MSGSTESLWRQLRVDSPVCAILYSSTAALQDVIELVRMVAPPEWHFVRTKTVADAFDDLTTPLLLTPADEAHAVEVLDGRRDALADRTTPVLLFLLRDGSGERALRNASGLASWLRGNEYDPEPPALDKEAECREFEQREGQSPRQWAEAFRQGQIPDTLENNYRYQLALLLEENS